MTPSRHSARLLVGLLLAYGALATWYSLVIPLGEGPDEVDHFGVIRYLTRHQQLPTTEKEHEAVQPPLYYLAGAALTFWIPDHTPYVVLTNADFDLSDPLAGKNLLLHPRSQAWPFRGWALAWHLVRLVSVALGAVTVWAVCRVGWEVFPERPAIGLGMAALTALTPQFLFMSAVVSNDSAAAATSALVLWQVAVIVRSRSLRSGRLILLGCLLGVGLLSKTSAMALLPVVGMAMLIVWWPERSHGGRRLLLAGLATFGVAALLAGWFFVRNLMVFGDPLGMSFILATNPVREGPLTWAVVVWLFQGLARSFWLGWMGIALEEGLYLALDALWLAGLLGLIAWLVLRWRQISARIRWTLGLLGLHAGLVLLSLVRWTAIVRGTDQGRLIYPMLPTVMLVLVGGLLVWLTARARAWGAGVLAAGWLMLAVITPGRYLAPVYGPAPTVDALPETATPSDVRFGESLRLVGFRLEEGPVQAGEKVSLYLYWQAEPTLEEDLWTRIEVVDASGAFLMYTDGSPSAGRDTTDRWTPGPMVASVHRLTIPEYAPPGSYAVTLGVHPVGEPTWLPVSSPDGSHVGDKLTFEVGVEVMAP